MSLLRSPDEGASDFRRNLRTCQVNWIKLLKRWIVEYVWCSWWINSSLAYFFFSYKKVKRISIISIIECTQIIDFHSCPVCSRINRTQAEMEICFTIECSVSTGKCDDIWSVLHDCCYYTFQNQHLRKHALGYKLFEIT